MFKAIWKDKFSTITKAATIIGAASFSSRILGLIRDRLLAVEFGAGNDLDIYYAAFRIPDFIYNLLILGALSAAFIPVFTSYLAKKREKEAWTIAAAILNWVMIAMVVIVGVLFFFVPQVVSVVAPGFDGEKAEMTVNLTRIMLLSPIIFGVSNIFSSILNSLKKFIVYAIAPIFYNLGIIIGIIWFVDWWGMPGLAIGVVLGATLHMLVQWPAAVKNGLRFKPVLGLASEGVRRIGKLMIPRILGLAAQQINLTVDTIIGSTLAIGSIAVFNLANNLQSFVVGVIGVSFAIATFPILAEKAAVNDFRGFIKSLSASFRSILFFIVPASILILLLRAHIVRLILGAGHFGWEDTILTAQTLGYFSISLFAQGLVPLLARSFYALQDTKTPVITSMIGVVVNVVGTLVFTRYMGVAGLALAFSVATFTNLVLMIVLLHIRTGGLDDNRIINMTGRLIVTCMVMGGATYGTLYLLAPFLNTHTALGLLIQTVGAFLVGSLVFVLVARLVRLQEIRLLKKWLPFLVK